MNIRSAVQQLSEEPNVWVMEMTRNEARDLVGEIDHENLETTMDEAQGAADATGKSAYIVIEIMGSRL